MFASNSATLLLAATVLFAGACAGVQANAAEQRLSDVGFINASRCAGLAQGAGYNASAFNAAVSAQGARREPLALIMADQARESAAVEAARPGYRKAAALRSLEGGCSPLVSQEIARVRPVTSGSASR